MSISPSRCTFSTFARPCGGKHGPRCCAINRHGSPLTVFVHPGGRCGTESHRHTGQFGSAQPSVAQQLIGSPPEHHARARDEHRQQ